MMRHERSHTKIIATLGPATSDIDVLRKLFYEGIDVCRLNFSHGTHDDHLKSIRLIRELNIELNARVAILADLQGPKLRIGDIENNQVYLKAGDEFSLISKECTGTKHQAYMSYELLPKDVKKGETILIDDGKIKLEVIHSNKKDRVITKIIHGGPLSSRKGVNLPSTNISLPAMTEKDKEDASFALKHKVDWIALSFVRSSTDIIELKDFMKNFRHKARIVAKIEKPEALKEIGQIIQISDAVMVARGDLGVEVDFEQVPIIQKSIVEKCIKAATPVIIATQMMESMMSNFRPTRAEATDVANAVIESADTLMLSGETSVGRYPDMVIKNMQKIIDWTEDHGLKYFRGSPPAEMSKTFLQDSMCFNAVQMAQQINAKAIITFTHSGYTAFRISSHRPKADIFAFTANKSLLPMLSLVWGVRAFHLESGKNIEDYINASINFLKEKKHIQTGDVIVHIGSIPLQKKGKTNMMKLSYI